LEVVSVKEAGQGRSCWGNREPGSKLAKNFGFKEWGLLKGYSTDPGSKQKVYPLTGRRKKITPSKTKFGGAFPGGREKRRTVERNVLSAGKKSEKNELCDGKDR